MHRQFYKDKIDKKRLLKLWRQSQNKKALPVAPTLVPWANTGVDTLAVTGPCARRGVRDGLVMAGRCLFSILPFLLMQRSREDREIEWLAINRTIRPRSCRRIHRQMGKPVWHGPLTRTAQCCSCTVHPRLGVLQPDLDRRLRVPASFQGGGGGGQMRCWRGGKRSIRPSGRSASSTLFQYF